MLDTRELGRRPGSQRRVSRTVPAPADLGIEVLRVPPGAPVHLDLRLEAVMDGVLVTGTAEADVVGECVRCLEPVSDHVGTDLQELYLYAEAGPEDDETSRLEGDLIDLEPVVRAAVVLALPFQPVCSDDCPGLCTQCGVALASSPGHHHEAELDPRWQELADFRQTLDDPGTSRVSDPSGQVKE